MTAVASPDLAAAMQLMDAAKNQGFRFERIAPGPDGPLRAVRETLRFRDVIYVGGLWNGCHATRTRKCSLVIPNGLLVTERVCGDAIEVLHTVVWDWPT